MKAESGEVRGVARPGSDVGKVDSGQWIVDISEIPKLDIAQSGCG